MNSEEEKKCFESWESDRFVDEEVFDVEFHDDLAAFTSFSSLTYTPLRTTRRSLERYPSCYLSSRNLVSENTDMLGFGKLGVRL